MGLWTDIVGSVRGYIRLGLTGVRLKNSSGALAVRNAGDTADAAMTCGALTLSDKITFADSSVLNSSPSGQFKNKIIGGDFTTNPWQRGTSFTNPGVSYQADRFALYKNTTAAVDILKTADAPTASEAGLFTRHCLHCDVTTADTSIASADAFWLEQRIEGYNAACFGFGQSGTRYVTLSFWVKSTKTGTFCVALQNSAQTRSYVAEYTVSVSDTWEKKTVTLAVDTTGTWVYDSGIGLRVFWTVAAGSAFHTTAGSWQTGAYFATSNQVNALDSTSNNFKLALIQLEAGSVATPFETRSIGQELALCQRYFYRLGNTGSLYLVPTDGQRVTTNIIDGFIIPPVTMCIAPTISHSGPSYVAAVPSGNNIGFYNNWTPGYATISGALTLSFGASTPTGVLFRAAAGASFSGSSGNTGHWYFGSTAYVDLSAEI